MRICLISTEIFAWGKFGGFGRATRMIGGELVKRGVEVIAVVPQRPGQRAVEQLDGITVLDPVGVAQERGRRPVRLLAHRRARRAPDRGALEASVRLEAREELPLQP